MIKNLLNVVENNTSIEITISKDNVGLTKLSAQVKTNNPVLNRKIKPIEFVVTPKTIETYIEITEKALSSVLPLISIVEAPEKPKSKRRTKAEIENEAKLSPEKNEEPKPRKSLKAEGVGVEVSELDNEKFTENPNLEDTEQW